MCAIEISLKSHRSIYTSEFTQVVCWNFYSRALWDCPWMPGTQESFFFHSFCLSRNPLIPSSGVKPYACDICNKTFSVKSYVTAHRWSHVSEKPLSCDRCSMTFTSKSQFAIHIRIHSSAGKSWRAFSFGRFAYPRLTNVLAITGQNFECNLCGRTFIRDSYLIRHHNRVHRDRVQSSSINATINAVVAQAVSETADDSFESNGQLGDLR